MVWEKRWRKESMLLHQSRSYHTINILFLLARNTLTISLNALNLNALPLQKTSNSISWYLPSPSFHFSLYFIDYAITVFLIFSPLPPSHQHPSLTQTTPHHCSCPWVMHISSLATPCPILYFTSPWLFCNYLFVLLNPLSSSTSFLSLHRLWLLCWVSARGWEMTGEKALPIIWKSTSRKLSVVL